VSSSKVYGINHLISKLFLVLAKSFYLAVTAYIVILVKTKKNEVSDGISNDPNSSASGALSRSDPLTVELTLAFYFI